MGLFASAGKGARPHNGYDAAAAAENALEVDEEAREEWHDPCLSGFDVVGEGVNEQR